MKSIKYFVLGGLITLIAASCGSLDNIGPLENDDKSPGVLSNISVTNLSGAARISYALPSDPDVLYVQASYENKMGEIFDFRSSYYTNSVTVDGFADASEYEVQLVTVDRSGNKSKPVDVVVAPLTPPVIETYQSLTITPDFGGIAVSFKNKSKADLAIVVTTPDSTGQSAIVKTFYTTRDSASFTVRGFESKPRKFGVYVRDRWDNTSDTLSSEVLPMYEVEIDKSKFKELFLPGDSECTSWGGAMPYIWDGLVLPDGDGFGCHTGNASTGVPKMITFDMGTLAQLSRFSIKTVADERHWFNDVTMKKYEIWGASELNPDGSLDGWTKLITYTSIKPSGLPIGLFTDDDRTAGQLGDEANFDLDLPQVRYIRIRCLENWSGNTNLVISEVTFWGSDK